MLSSDVLVFSTNSGEFWKKQLCLYLILKKKTYMQLKKCVESVKNEIFSPNYPNVAYF